MKSMKSESETLLYFFLVKYVISIKYFFIDFLFPWQRPVLSFKENLSDKREEIDMWIVVASKYQFTSEFGQNYKKCDCEVFT